MPECLIRSPGMASISLLAANVDHKKNLIKKKKGVVLPVNVYGQKNEALIFIKSGIVTLKYMRSSFIIR